MSTGMIFDIKEFAINDGPGIRISIFMKGCPLRCVWCHNPEGLDKNPQMNFKTNRIVGKEYSVEEIVSKIRKFKDVFTISNGGVTFCGGEPTLQSDFIYDVAASLPDIHKNLDTSGYCNSEIFKKLITVFDLIYFDIKLVDEKEHLKYTGVSNKLILENLKILSDSNTKYHIRIPLIPNITDTKYNLSNIENLIFSLKNKPLRVDPLPYNILAGGKYPSFKMVFPLEKASQTNNIANINEFKHNLNLNGIKTMGDDVKCLQND
jgi:pyruvate formate lyase activating enzyme